MANARELGVEVRRGWANAQALRTQLQQPAGCVDKHRLKRLQLVEMLGEQVITRLVVVRSTGCARFGTAANSRLTL